MDRLQTLMDEARERHKKELFSDFIAAAASHNEGEYVTSNLLGYTVVAGKIPSPFHREPVPTYLSDKMLAQWPKFYRVGYVLYPLDAPPLTVEQADQFSVHGGVTFNFQFKDGLVVGFDTHHGWEADEHQTDEYVMGEIGDLVAQMTKHRKASAQ